eukprot:2609535-Prymnesium_polylepis.2
MRPSEVLLDVGQVAFGANLSSQLGDDVDEILVRGRGRAAGDVPGRACCAARRGGCGRGQHVHVAMRVRRVQNVRWPVMPLRDAVYWFFEGRRTFTRFFQSA